MKDKIIHCASEHNLKILISKYPKKFLVVLLAYRSGKAPAFDTIYAEGQRRYVSRFQLTLGNFGVDGKARC